MKENSSDSKEPIDNNKTWDLNELIVIASAPVARQDVKDADDGSKI